MKNVQFSFVISLIVYVAMMAAYPVVVVFAFLSNQRCPEFKLYERDVRFVARL